MKTETAITSKTRLEDMVFLRRAAREFGLSRGWRLAHKPFRLEEFVEAGAVGLANASHRLWDHPYFYRDRGRRPVAIVVHLYDWPEIGPDVEVMCDALGLKYEAPDGVRSWWCPGVTQIVVYTKRRKPKKAKEVTQWPEEDRQLDLPFK